MPAVDFPDVIDAADIGMGQLTGDAHFRKEAFPAYGILGKCRREEFQRYRLTQLQIVRPVNFPHASTSEQSYDAVAIR